MNILVIGAGAIGGYLGARLLHSGQTVIMLDRPEMTAVVNELGIRVEEGGETIHVRPEAVSSYVEAFARHHAFDLTVLALKSYDLPEALAALQTSAASSGTILTVGNGIGIEEPFVEAFGGDRVLAGSLTTPVSKKGPAHLVVERSGRGLGLAPAEAGQLITPWVELFTDAAITAVPFTGYESMKWSKALLNIVSNATSAILEMSPGEVYADPRLFDLEVRMLQETLGVMQQRGLAVVDLPGSPARRLAQAVQIVPRFLLQPILTRLVAGGRGEKMPSFYIDLVSGRGQSEVIFHNGAIAAAGEALGSAMPVNRTLNDVLLALTTGEQARESFAGRPERLLAEVAAAAQAGKQPR